MPAKTFTETGDFAAYNAAKQYVAELGYSAGPMCRDEPIAMKKGDWHIAKWKNLSRAERKDVDGLIEGNKRNGPVTVTLY